MTKAADYYYAKGERIPLDRADELVALEAERVAGSRLAAASQDEIRKAGKPLRRGVVLIDRSHLTEEVDEAITKARVGEPVYREGDVLVVPLAEIRAEGDGADYERVRAWLDEHDAAATVTRRSRGQLVIHPETGGGEAALRLANEMHEQLGIESVQPRMLRVVARPDAKGSGDRPESVWD